MNPSTVADSPGFLWGFLCVCSRGVRWIRQPFFVIFVERVQPNYSSLSNLNLLYCYIGGVPVWALGTQTDTSRHAVAGVLFRDAHPGRSVLRQEDDE